MHITMLTHKNTFTSLLQQPNITTALGMGSADDQGQTKADFWVPQHA
jgi:hypothetical protein